MSNRHAREGMVSEAICGADDRWNRNLYEVPGAVAEWMRRFPDVPIVDDGETKAGRGDTAKDLGRRVDDSGISRFDYLAIKTGTVESSGKVPSQFKICTGNPETINGIISGIEAGASFPTLFFCSKRGTDGEPSPRGYALFADLAPVFREYGIAGIEQYPDGGYERGKAPPLYVKWSSPRRSGTKTLARMRKAGLPVDETVRIINGVMCGPGWFRYQELTLSLASLGVRKSSWYAGIHVNSLGLMLDRQEGFGPGSEVTWEDLA